VHFFTDSLTRSSLVLRRARLSMVTTRSTKRSVRSRISRVSTKPVSVTENIVRASTPCDNPRGLPGRGGKAGRNRRDHDSTAKNFCRRNSNATAQSAIATATATGSIRLVIGRKIERDAGAERDRHPRQQPARTRLRAHPLAQGFDEWRPGAENGRCKPPTGAPRAAARPGIAAPSTRRIALLRHLATRDALQAQSYRNVSYQR